jgi:hypothetical protein
MYLIHYLDANGGLVGKETFPGETLAGTIQWARRNITQVGVAVAHVPGHSPHAAGFYIFDATGTKVLHQEQMG